MELIEEEEFTISIFGVEVVATVVVWEFGVERFKEHNVVEGVSGKEVTSSRKHIPYLICWHQVQ